MMGEGGQDRLYGGNGDDELNGGDDGIRDYLYGQDGRDHYQQDYYLGYEEDKDKPPYFTENWDFHYDI